MYIIEIERTDTGSVVRLFRNERGNTPLAERVFENAFPQGIELTDPTAYICLSEIGENQHKPVSPLAAPAKS